MLFCELANKTMQRLSTKEFDHVMQKGKWVHGALFSLRITKNDAGHLHFGVAVSKKLAKKATQRNYYKRVLRHILRTIIKEAGDKSRMKGCDVVLVAHPEIQHKKFIILKEDVQNLLKKADVFLR